MIEKLKPRITQVPGLSKRADVLLSSFFGLEDQNSKRLGNMSQEVYLVNDVSGFEHGSVQLQRQHM